MGPTSKERTLALALYTALMDNPDEDEDRVTRRVARQLHVSTDELMNAYLAVVADPEAGQQMIQLRAATR